MFFILTSISTETNMLKKVPQSNIFYCQFDGKNFQEVQMLVTAINQERKSTSVSIVKWNDGAFISDSRVSLVNRAPSKLKPGNYFVQEGTQWSIVPEDDFKLAN